MVEHITKRFDGVTALRDFSFRVREGEVLALIGPNGAGKTTTFNLITGFYRPDAGSIRFRGEELIGLTPEEICHRGVCRTFQTAQPFQRLSVEENVLVGALFGKGRRPSLDDARRRAREVLEIMGMDHEANIAAGALTLARQRRLELARALATQPTMLLLDEVIAGLTAVETREYVALLRRIRERGMTIVLIEHVLRAVMDLAEDIVVLNNGEKLAEGLPAEIAANREVIRAYMGEKPAPG